MKMIALIIMVAIVLEGVVEYCKTIMKMVENKEYKTAITQAITIVIAIGFAFGFHLQLFNGAMSEFYEGLQINPIFDTILTGILFSRGSNYISDFINKLQKPTIESNNVVFEDEWVEDLGENFEDFEDFEEDEEKSE